MKPILDIRNLGVRYKKIQVLKDISFSVFPGEFMAIIGPNGCGKTTLVNTILKSVVPENGTVHIQGKPVTTLSNSDLSRHLAAVMQSMDPVAMTVKAYVQLGRLPYFKPYQFFETPQDIDTAQKYMVLTGIDHLAEAKLNEISGGERQLAAIARALTQEAPLLVLDEPTSHLDITHQVRILDLITTLKTDLSLTILMVLHDLNLAGEFADRLVLLDKASHGIFSCGTPKAVLTRETIQQVYQTRVHVQPNPVTQSPCVFLVKSQD